MPTDRYESPLASRYASDEMLALFSPDRKFTQWHRLWIALARAEKKLGLPIRDEQIREMEEQAGKVDYERAGYWEDKLRHDVMAHIKTFGEQCPKAAPIIHLGATSCFVGDNTDIILMREGLQILCRRAVRVLAALADFAERYKDLPTLGFTHFQPAQPVTVGKRATLWMNDLLEDLTEAEYRIDRLALLGCRGTTGTGAGFLELFDGDAQKVEELNREIAREMGFDKVVPVSGQTYSRKTDAAVLATLSGFAQSASKFAVDLRLLCHLKEVEEPFEESQVGSSAMPYKRNPMRSERICSLARYVISDAQNAAQTAANQWLERTLDDSANKRIAVPEAFLATDAVLLLWENIASGLTVHEKVIAKHLEEELPFMATENIMMDAVKKGGDRQEIHALLRRLSLEAGSAVKDRGEANDLAERMAREPALGLTRREIDARLDPGAYIGCCPLQVTSFLRAYIDPVLTRYSSSLSGNSAKIKV